MSVENLSGRTLGQYELRELLGVGGMGAVYRAYQSSLDRDVAVKVLSALLAAQSGYSERFIREAKTAAALEHAHIVPVYDYGTTDDKISYVVMRLLTGGSLSDRLQAVTDGNSALPPLDETARILRQLADALDYAHQKGVIHRDIKASNVMFNEQNSAFLVDFGIAKLLDSTTNLTVTGMAMGTPSYMPPEQWKGEEIGPAADQYALGIMTYAMVTGKMPFEGPTPYALMHKHLYETPTPPQTWRADVPQGVIDVLNRAMAKTADERYASALEFANAFERAIQGHPEAKTSAGVPIPVSKTPTALPQLPTSPAALDGPTVRTPTGIPAAGHIPAPQPAAGDVSKQTLSTAPQSIKRGALSSPVVWIAAVITFVVLGGLALLLLSAVPRNDPQGTETAAAVQGSVTAAALALLATDTPIASSTPVPSDTATATETASPTPRHTDTATPSHAVIITTREIAARGGPGSEYPIIGQLAADTQVNILGISEDGAWYQVELPEGKIGWLPAASPLLESAGDLVSIPIAAAPTNTPSDTPTMTITATATATATATTTETATSTNTPRPRPSATNTVRPTRPPLSTIQPPPPTQVRPQLISCPDAVLPSRLAPGMRGVVLEEDRRDVNVRSGPGRNFPIIARIIPGETFEVIDGPSCTDRLAWFNIRYGGGVLEGWIAEGDEHYFVGPIGPPPPHGADSRRNAEDMAVLGTCRATIVEDDFEGGFSANDWFVAGGRSIERIGDRAYEIILGDDPERRTEATSWGSLRGVTLRDAQVEGVIRSPQFTPEIGARTGLWVRYQDENNFLAFMIRGDGSFRVARYEGGSYVDLVGWQASRALRIGRDAVNTVRIDSVGDNFTFYINGERVAEAVDSTWAEGRVAFWGSSPTTPAMFYLEYFRVCAK